MESEKTMLLHDTLSVPSDQRYSASKALFERAKRIIPGGGHLSGRPLLTPSNSPLYIEKGRGARCWDVDGNEYIDYFMAFGPMLLGYAHPEVDAAVSAQLKTCTLLSLNHPLHVRFAERMLKQFPHFDRVVFVKTGSEATTSALRIARRCTGRRKVVRCGYHGWHDWCLPSENFVPEGLNQQVLEFDVNDPQTLIEILGLHRNQVAAVIVAPEMTHPDKFAVFHDLLAITRQHGAVFILDEVKTGFRVTPGSFHEHVGIDPDLVTFSKALGNGWPIAAVLGKKKIMDSAVGMHISATYHGELAGIVAALAMLDVLNREDVCGHVWHLGEQLISGLNALARYHGVKARAYGEPVPSMPFLRFEEGDTVRNARVANAFYEYAFAHGVLFHPRHLWFISYAHTSGDITHTLEMADRAFARASQA